MRDDKTLSGTIPGKRDRQWAAAPPSGPAAGPPVAVGDRLGERYLVLEALGSGGFGSVVRARDLKLDREVALKLLHGFARSVSADELDAALQEGRALARLQHPNIVPVFDAGTLDGLPFLTMGLVRGRPLDAFLETEGALPPARAVGLIEQLCAALDHAHEERLIHRDVKPVNIIIDEGDQLQLVDFGIALQRRGQEEKAPEWISGTVGYIAPEVLEGEVADARSDQFAAAVTFYEMIAGRRAFASKTPSQYVAAVQTAPLQPLDNLPSGSPRAIREVLARALSPDPSLRFPNCGAFARELRRIVDGPARRRRRWLAATAVVTLGLAGAFLWPRQSLEVSSNLRGLVEARDGSRVEISVDDRAALTAGDWFWLDDVSVTREAHVAVVLLDSSGELSVLCPGPACQTSGPLAPGIPHRLPPEGQPSWQLDDSTGFESVFLLASLEPVTDDEVRRVVGEAERRVVGGADSAPRTRGVRAAPLPDTLELRVGRERELVLLLADRFDHVRSHRVLHE